MTILGCTALSVSCLMMSQAKAEETAAAGEAEAVQPNKELDLEIRYIGELLNWGLSDFANDVMAATIARWPESEPRLFALEIRRLLLEGNFDEAEKRLAALPDKTGPKYWAARLELANNYYVNDKRKECGEIYEAFFKANKKPSKELAPLMRDAIYNRINLLISGGKRREAAGMYEMLQTYLNTKEDEGDNEWCAAACEAADLWLSLAADKPDSKARKPELDAAKKHIGKLLYRNDRMVYFGRAIAMKAYYELLNGNEKKALAVIDDYKDNLQEIHDELVKADPNGSLGWLRQSPMPQCRYLLADRLWKEAQNEAKKPKPDDEKIKSLLFGAKVGGAASKKRDGKGAFNNVVNVYLRFPQSVWAPKAGRLWKEIDAFVLDRYGSVPKVNKTPEQERQVMEAQFRSAKEKFSERDWKGAIADYYVALGNYPEADLSVAALENVATCYLNLADAESEGKRKTALLDMAAAIEGHLADRFGSVRAIKLNKMNMINAGSAVLRLAAREKASKRPERAEALYEAFLQNYLYHPESPRTALGLGFEAQKAALEIYKGSALGPISPDDTPELRADKEALLITSDDTPDVRAQKEAARAQLKEQLVAEYGPYVNKALKWYGLVETNYKEDLRHRMTKAYPDALRYSSNCYELLGDAQQSVAYLEAYTKTIDEADQPLQRFQSELNVATLHQKLGAAALDVAKGKKAEADKVKAGAAAGAAQLRADADLPANAEKREDLLAEAEKLEKDAAATCEPLLAAAKEQAEAGEKELAICINSLDPLAKKAQKLIANPKIAGDEKRLEKAKALYEGTLYNLSDCYGRRAYPEEKVPEYRAKQYENLEKYVAEYPQGRYAKNAYFKLGLYYCTVDEFEKGQQSLQRLKENFPGSAEARIAMPMLAKALLNYAATLTGEDDTIRAKRKQMLDLAGQTYRDMLNNGKGEYSPQDYISAAEVLLKAKEWSLADEAFSKAETVSKALAKDKPAYHQLEARAHLGKAKMFMARGDVDSARVALDDFLTDPNLSRMTSITNACELMVTVAMRQGEQEPDAAKRKAHYSAAMDSVKRLRSYWSKNTSIPQWRRDDVELMSSDISISRMDAESAHGGDKEAKEKHGADAIKKLDTFIKARTSQGVQLKGMHREEVANLEKAYADLVGVHDRLGSSHANDVMAWSKAYFEHFPTGANQAAVKSARNRAIENGGTDPVAAPTPGTSETPETPAEGEAAAEPKAEAPEATAETTADDDEGTVAVEEPLAEEALPAEESVSTELEPAASEPAVDEMTTNE